jgi:hypothetical protein
VDRAQYARYLLSRLAQSLLIMLGAAMLAHLLRLLGWPRWAATGPSGGILPAARYVAWPALCALAAHLLLGPKQARPVYRRMPGAMFVYAGVKVSRSAGCRGGLITGSTGSGKTLCCIMPRLHSLCVNESGSELPSWRRSRARRELEEMRRLHRRLAAEEGEHGSRLGAARQAAAARGNTLRALRAMGSAALGPSEPSPGVSEIDAELARMRTQAQARAARLAELADACRPARYRCAPWGGFVCGEKGNEWRSIAELLACHGRQEDLCLLATRPSWAPPDWRPAVRLNLICMGGVPADTYAQMIVDTALSVEESATRDEFFVPQARDKIAWGLRLVRAIGAGGHRPAASLLTVLDILTVQESYRRYLAESVAERPHLASSAALDEARFQLENNYWNQPPDQLGGVRSTVHNFLAPFAEPEIAEVFCADSTFDLRDIELGKVVCLAIPQRLAVQRRYVATLIKALVYRIVVERFDRRHDAPGWAERNVILVEQDEWQRHAVRADCEVDIVREAQGAVYAATQSQNAVWLKLGGRDRAAPLIANLRNRWICQAATDECAEESSSLVSGRISRQVSYTHGDGGRSTSVSFPEVPFVPKRELRSLAPFRVVFAPAEGRWLYRACIAMPATPDGRIPEWWFGDWNPAHWLLRALGLPEHVRGVRIHPGDALVPPWRACAPLRAQLRWLAGLDGTFIVTGGVRAPTGRGR